MKHQANRLFIMFFFHVHKLIAELWSVTDLPTEKSSSISLSEGHRKSHHECSRKFFQPNVIFTAHPRSCWQMAAFLSSVECNKVDSKLSFWRSTIRWSGSNRESCGGVVSGRSCDFIIIYLKNPLAKNGAGHSQPSWGSPFLHSRTFPGPIQDDKLSTITLKDHYHAFTKCCIYLCMVGIMSQLKKISAIVINVVNYVNTVW